MAYKIEKWLRDVFPGPEHIFSAYNSLKGRELAVIASSVLDLALAELLHARLRDYAKESEEFLGLNEDGRAPCGSFGARIQLAVLVGVITPEDASMLRVIKSIRNCFAHRVNVDFLNERIQGSVHELFRLLYEQGKRLHDKGIRNWSPEPFDTLKPYLKTTPEACEGLLLAVLGIYQAYFHRLSEQMVRIEDVRKPTD